MLWIAQTARLEWSDFAAEMVTLQQLEHGPCRDVFGVIVHDTVLKTEDATHYSVSHGHEVVQSLEYDEQRALCLEGVVWAWCRGVQ